MNRRTFSELQIPSTVSVATTSDICGARFESEQLYRLCLPSDASPSTLMRLRGGELDNMLTTALRGPKGFVGSAGLKPVSVSSISPLITLRHLQAVSACIDRLTDDLGRLQRERWDDYHSDVESAISTLADIAPRVGDAALNESYRTTLLVDVRATKRQLLGCFEKELKEFERHVGQRCDEVRKATRDGQYSDGWINNISCLGRSKIFSILGFLAICELFEVILFGDFSESLMQASYKTLTAQRNKMFTMANKFYEAVIHHLEQWDNQNSWQDAGRAWHLARIEEHSKKLDKAWSEFVSLEKPPALLEAFLNGDATKVEAFWFSVRDDRISILTDDQLLSADAMLLASDS